MPMVICNRFYERLANNGKITTFMGLTFFDALTRRLPWTLENCGQSLENRDLHCQNL